MAERYVVAVDVGTGSVRAAVISSNGTFVKPSFEATITTNRPQDDHYEQSSDEIWQRCGEAVRSALRASEIKAESVVGIAFDATCSLVALDDKFAPVSISTTQDNTWNIIVWMDHRAAAEAAYINSTSHSLLKYVGGAMSLEMQPPKLLWLKKHHPTAWNRARHFFDYLSFRATDNLARSSCTVTCKWAYDAPNKTWDASFFDSVGLSELAENNFSRIGAQVKPVGVALGRLTASAAAHFGLSSDVIVSTGLIDAHAGGLGLLGAPVPRFPHAASLESRIAIIGGTSTCLMACSEKPIFVKGVWGPYLSAMVPDMWLSEGGESATGALLDHCVMSHSTGQSLKNSLGSLTAVFKRLDERLVHLGLSLASPCFLTRDVHVLPYFHGNRAPRADSSLRGVISGLTLDTSEDSLALLYLATVQALAHGTKHIIDEMNQCGYRISLLFITGGLSKNALFVSELADICNMPVVLSRETEAVLLGTSIAAATASGLYSSIAAAQAAMCAAGDVILPKTDNDTRLYRDAKHKVFLMMYEQQMHLRQVMQTAKK